jgi:hypothetical protein
MGFQEIPTKSPRIERGKDLEVDPGHFIYFKFFLQSIVLKRCTLLTPGC